MATLYANGWVVTMDDAGTEHADGWVLVEDATIASVGTGPEPVADERIDLGGAVVTPGLVNTHHHLYQTLTRARAQQADLFTWLRELYPVWAEDRRRGGVRSRAHGARRAGALRLLDRLRPPLRLPARTARHLRGGGRGGARAGRSPRRVARLDGPRGLGRRPAARRARRGARRGARRDRAAPRRLPRERPRSPRAARGRSVLAVLGHGTTDGGVGGARTAARPRAPYAPRRDRGGGGVLPGALRVLAGGVPRAPRLARRRRVVRPLRAPLGRGGRALCGDRDGRGALPDVQPAPRRGRRAGSCPARCRRARRPGRRRLGLERAERPVPRGQAGAARRARPLAAGRR